MSEIATAVLSKRNDIQGIVNGPHDIQGIVNGPQRLTGSISIGGSSIPPGSNVGPIYDGTYSVTPSVYEAQVLGTAGKYLEEDVNVKKIPYFETSNTSGGNTVYIGTEV